MRIRVQLKVDQLEQKARAAKKTVRAKLERAVDGLANEAMRERFGTEGRIASQDAGAAFNRWQSLSSVFIPVTLKHKRREQWPNLSPIYTARVLRGQSTYQGREKFYVDERKLDALRERINAQSFGRLSPGEWQISITRADFGLRVRVQKRGQTLPGDERTALHIAARIRARFAEIAAGLLRDAIQEAGFH